MISLWLHLFMRVTLSVSFFFGAFIVRFISIGFLRFPSPSTVKKKSIGKVVGKVQ